MQIQFWGAAQTVTGSMHLVRHRGRQVLLDCGLYQGHRKEAFRRNRELPFDAREIDAVVLSHAHIDHSGNLPSLVRGGFHGPIFSTSATRDLASYMLIDSAKIQESDVEYVNRRRKKNHETPFEPLYVQEDAVRTLKRFRTIDFDDEFEVLPGIRCRFHFAGHMLGAAHVELLLDPEDPADVGNRPPTRVVFSGDIGRPEQPMLRDPEIIAGADYLLMEATYGDRLHPEGSDARAVLKAAAERTYESGGKLIIPAFSVGRTQEIVYRLNNLFESGELAPLRVFVDSPLAVNATDVFRAHLECFDDEMVERVLTEEDEDPLAFGDLHYIRKASLSKELNHYKQPCIIISASGMCEAGRVLHHLKNNIEDPATTILFAGFQAPHTLGRRILDGQEEEVPIFGKRYRVRAQVCRLEGSSGHADQGELLEWARQVNEAGNLKRIALVHCEPEPAAVFRNLLEQHQLGPVLIPARGEIMDLDRNGELLSAPSDGDAGGR